MDGQSDEMLAARVSDNRGLMLRLAQGEPVLRGAPPDVQVWWVRRALKKPTARRGVKYVCAALAVCMPIIVLCLTLGGLMGDVIPRRWGEATQQGVLMCVIVGVLVGTMLLLVFMQRLSILWASRGQVAAAMRPLRCASCGYELPELTQRLAGEQVRCPECGTDHPAIGPQMADGATATAIPSDLTARASHSTTDHKDPSLAP